MFRKMIVWTENDFRFKRKNNNQRKNETDNETGQTENSRFTVWLRVLLCEKQWLES